jgi:hypothetical protein
MNPDAFADRQRFLLGDHRAAWSDYERITRLRQIVAESHNRLAVLKDDPVANGTFILEEEKWQAFFGRELRKLESVLFSLSLDENRLSL